MDPTRADLTHSGMETSGIASTVPWPGTEVLYGHDQRTGPRDHDVSMPCRAGDSGRSATVSAAFFCPGAVPERHSGVGQIGPEPPTRTKR